MAARRLYLRLYLAFLGVLLAVGVVVSLVNLLYGRPFFAMVRGGPRMAAHLARMLPGPGAPPAMLDRALEQFHDELGVDVLVVGLHGEALAQAGASIRLPEAKALERARREPAWLPGSGLVAAPMRGGAVLLARLPVPEAESPDYHLSTLFPPVRPRGGYLEVRYLDAQPFWRIGEAVTTVATLLYDAQARRDALDLLLPRAGDQQRAWTEATTGFSPEAGALLSIARAAQRPRVARPVRALAMAGGGGS